MTDNDSQTETSSPAFSPKQFVWLAVLILLLVCLGWLGRSLLNDYLVPGGQVTELSIQGSCDLHQDPCMATSGKQQLQLTIDAEHIDSKTPLRFMVDLQGFEADQVRIQLQGKEMFMGDNHLSLNKVAEGRFESTAQLPVCSTGKMIWQATVTTGSNPTYTAVFEFEAR